GGGGDMMELSGSTRILTILPEGTRVKEGEIVCTLESAPLEAELQEQMIRYAQAQAWVEQVEKTLEVAQIELEQYTSGIYPQDRLLCDQYIDGCEMQLAEAELELQ